MRRKGAATVGTVAALSVALAGCTASASTPPIAVTHVHAVDLDDELGAVYVATHEGILRITVDTSAADAVTSSEVGSVERLGEWTGDVMGMARLGDTIYLSGHPAPGASSPANIGVYQADVLGQEIVPLSLDGEVDFHSMTIRDVSGASLALAGIDSASGRVIASRDGGETWTVGAAISARSLSWDVDAQRLFATTEQGLQVSTDGGETFTLVKGAPLLLLISSASAGSPDAYLAGVDVEGYVHTSTDGVTWNSGGLAPALTAAVSVGSEGSLVAAGIQGVYRSTDRGATWVVIVEF